jgi:GntR family negative regulator for fad regulon and positive regulator of fabA
VEHSEQLPADFVPHLLEVRLQLAPAYTRAAVERRPEEIVTLLAESKQLGEVPAAYASFDWRLQHHLTVWSGNPIYTLILNGFRDFYQDIAVRYFAPTLTQAASLAYYEALSQAAVARDSAAAETIARQVMEASMMLWRQISD